MRLSRRLEAVITACGRGKVAADVGCDHGFVALELVSRGLYERTIAMDIRKGPLSRAEEHVAEQRLEERVEIRLSDGLAELRPGEADTIVIAGMGGPLMQDILTKGESTAKAAAKLVLSPQSDIAAFRKFLIQNGYRITDEEMVLEEGKYYVILQAEPGECEPWSPEEYRYGKTLIHRGHPVLSDALKKKIEQCTTLAEKLEQSGSGPRTRERLGEILREKEIAGEVLARMNSRSAGEKRDEGMQSKDRR